MLAKSAADVVAGCILIRTDPIISTKSLFFCSMLTFLAFPSASFPSKQLASCIFKYSFSGTQVRGKLGPCYLAIPFPDAGKPAGRWTLGKTATLWRLNLEDFQLSAPALWPGLVQRCLNRKGPFFFENVAT